MRALRPADFPIAAVAVGNALGATTTEVAAALAEGRSGLVPCRLDVPFETTCGHFPDVLEPLPAALGDHDTRLARIAVAVLDGIVPAVERAVRRFGRERVALVLGTSTGGILSSEEAFEAWSLHGRVPDRFDMDRQHAFHALLEVVRWRTGITGPSWIVSTACSSSAKVLASARRLLAAGLADAVLTGGADTLCQTTLRGFASLEALSKRPCRPFGAERDGTSIGEGAAFLLIEREGDAPVRLLGVGESSDAHHMSHPHPQGLGARSAMQAALRDAALEPADVGHVNAHGTATLANDAVEAAAILEVLGARARVASTKAYTGHLLGAAGATEAVLAALAVERGFVPASLGSTPLDPAVKLDVCAHGRQEPVRCALSNSFGFGGSNATVVVGSPA